MQMSCQRASGRSFFFQALRDAIAIGLGQDSTRGKTVERTLEVARDSVPALGPSRVCCTVFALSPGATVRTIHPPVTGVRTLGAEGHTGIVDG